ncbi:MAG TPA: NADH-ubiquinone oxidoreductase-F iron-sulfur binding region domain-containing protein [Solirubrobacteraceae bacterium]|jgi:NADH:ubiquinone oxidoreductase subunit F (NADH-binding)|nr:NADH-ubiquinone oxidoreductase-F iron-sulfur binding region domain-containing protein [Solirubrobacteraceae bacterium]
MSASPASLSSAPAAVTAPAGLPRLLASVLPDRAMTLAEHTGLHGGLPALAQPRGRGGRATALIEELERSGLRGHGGAGFPTWMKLRAVADARRRALVVVNAVEAEPASLKDRTLTELLPQLVLDGAILAAGAIGADEVIVCVSAAAPESVNSLRAAIAEREGAPGPEGAGSPPRLRLEQMPDHYVAGEESAVVSRLNDGPARPTFRPPMPFERGVGRRPTLVNNAETLAHVALIARHGAGWFRELGPAGHPGSALVTLAGPVADPGVYEIAHGASLSSLIAAGGGTTEPLRAALIGGYAGSWIAAERLHAVALSDEHLAAHGASLGAGVVALLSEQACPVAETARVARWMADQSAGQCGPCVHGLGSLATTLEELSGGVGRGGGALPRLERLAGVVAGRGACGHPDGAVNLIVSALRCFASDFADHARHGRCERCLRESELPLPVRRPQASTTWGPGR